VRLKDAVRLSGACVEVWGSVWGVSGIILSPCPSQEPSPGVVRPVARERVWERAELPKFPRCGPVEEMRPDRRHDCESPTYNAPRDDVALSRTVPPRKIPSFGGRPKRLGLPSRAVLGASPFRAHSPSNGSARAQGRAHSHSGLSDGRVRAEGERQIPLLGPLRHPPHRPCAGTPCRGSRPGGLRGPIRASFPHLFSVLYNFEAVSSMFVSGYLRVPTAGEMPSSGGLREESQSERSIARHLPAI